jgi:ribonuclease P/MRP protein subunit RPP25
VTSPDVVTADPSKKEERPKRERQPRKDGERETAENEIMVAAKGKIKSYLGYAFRILIKTDYRELKIKATGNAIVKALILVELIKKKVGEIHNYDLHQSNKIYSMEIVSIEQSKIEGMDAIESRRRVAAMDTVLSKDPLDESEPGYQFCKAEPKEPGA